MSHLYKDIYKRACELERSGEPVERVFSVLLHRVSHALHDIDNKENPRDAIIKALSTKKQLFEEKK